MENPLVPSFPQCLFQNSRKIQTDQQKKTDCKISIHNTVRKVNRAVLKTEINHGNNQCFSAAFWTPVLRYYDHTL